ncbi:MAG: hypothetical protein H8D45_32795 [Bacteroidetes bacterium]|nr:hypothetical protein [Bacteroidota bacterium]
MNAIKFHILFQFPLFLIAMVFYSCSTTSDTVTPGPAAYPTINLTVGSSYTYTIDSLHAGGGSTRLGNNTRSTILANGTYFDSTDVFMTQVIERDGGGQTVSNDTTFTKYNDATGKGYSYGFSQLFNPALIPKWDLLADFSIALNTTWVIDNINVILTIPQGNVNMTGPLTGQVAEETTIQTTGSPSEKIYCYRIELNATLSGTIVISSVTYTLNTALTMDYYIGYSSSQHPGNPSGVVRLTNRTFTITTNPNIGTFPFPGRDRILETYSIVD